MKVPPKRKGNLVDSLGAFEVVSALNESPSEKEGKVSRVICGARKASPLNESPSEKEGKPGIYHEDGLGFYPQ